MLAFSPAKNTDIIPRDNPSIIPAKRLPPTRETITVKRYLHQLFLPSDAFFKNDIDELSDDIVFTPYNPTYSLFYNIMLINRLIF